MNETPDEKAPFHTQEGDYENKIVSHLVCETAHGLEIARNHFVLPWLVSNKWGTAITLTITAQDQSGLNPGISLLRPFENHVFSFPLGGPVTSAQSFAMGAGATYSENSTRTETIQFTLLNSDLFKLAQNHAGNCSEFEGGLKIDGDLKIREFIYDKAEVAVLGNGNLFPGKDTSNDYKYPLYNTFTDTINFTSTYGGNLTPSWKLAKFSNNTTTPGLLTAQRTYTNNVIITIGTLGKAPTETTAASLDASGAAQHQAQVQGAANATAMKGQTGF